MIFLILIFKMDYSILKCLIMVFLIQHCTSEDVTSNIRSSSAVSPHDESPALLQEQEPAAPELVPVVAPPSLQEVQQAVQEASEKEGQGAEEVLKGLLERVVEAALGAGGEAKVDEPSAVTVEEAGTGEDSQTGEVEKEVVDDTGVEQELVDALAGGTVVVEGNSETIITDANEEETHEEISDQLNNNMELSHDVPKDQESAAEMVVGEEPVQETVEGLDLSPGLLEVEQESVIVKKHELIDTSQTIAEEALEQAIDSNILQDNEMPRTGDVEGNLVLQEVESEQVEAVEAEEMGDGETVIEGGSIVPKVTDGSKAGEEEATPEATNSREDEDQEVQQVSDGESQDSAVGVVGEGLQQATELLPETPPPHPALSGTETGGSAPGGERLNHYNEIISTTDDQAPAQPDNAVREELFLPNQMEGEQPGEATELVEDATNDRAAETRELGLEAWKIGAICAAALLLLETVVIIAYILRNWSKNSSSRQRVCEEGSVEPEATTGADYNDDTLPAGNGDAQQNAVLDPSKVAATLLQNKDQQEVQQVIPMSELEDTPNNTAAPEPSQDRRTSAL